ncbi:MAG: SMC-Scp complex subunit ScpB [Planctomycetaceae bacterium]
MTDRRGRGDGATSRESAVGWRWRFASRGDGSRSNGGTSANEERRTAKLARLEAVLFVADGPLAPRKLAQHALVADAAEVHRLIERLNAGYDRTGSAFRVEQVSTGWQLLTRPEFAPWLERLHQRKSELRLSPPALETLAIIAHRQPITRADIEAIRGVQSTEMLKQLMERGLVKIAGEDESLGRPYLYGTTRQFLELFGLQSLEDLPR